MKKYIQLAVKILPYILGLWILISAADKSFLDGSLLKKLNLFSHDLLIEFVPRPVRFIILLLIGIFGLNKFSDYSPVIKSWQNRIKSIFGIVQGEAVIPEKSYRIVKDIQLHTYDLCTEQISNSLSSLNKYGNKDEPDYIEFPSEIRKFKSINDFQSNSYEINNHGILSEKLASSKIQFIALIGDAGSGKSFNLWKWVRKNSHPNLISKSKIKAPVLINISDFASIDKEYFIDWLSIKIANSYGKKDKQIKTIIENDHFFFCLDGLDEVEYSSRIDCLESIIELSKDHSVIISSRISEFKEVTGRLTKSTQKLSRLQIYELCQLTDNDIASTVKTYKTHFQELYDYYVGMNNTWLLEYMRTPLMFALTTYVFKDIKEDEKLKLKSASKEDVEVFLWQKFDIKRSEEKIPDKTRRERVRWWLHSLALIADSGTVYLDQIQPDWLTDTRRIRLYFLLSRVLSTIALSISVGLIFASFSTFISSGAACGLAYGLTSIYLGGWNSPTNYKRYSGLQSVLIVLLYVLIGVACGALFRGLSVERREKDMVWLFSKTDIVGGILFGFFSGLIFGIRKIKQGIKGDIQTLEQWGKIKWTSFLGSVLTITVIVSLVIGVIGDYIYKNYPETTFGKWLRTFIMEQHLDPFYFPLAAGSFFGLYLGVLVSIRESFESEDGEKKKKQSYIMYGLYSSFQFSLKAFSVIFILLGSLCLYLLDYAFGPLSAMRGLATVTGLALIASLVYGGIDIINHVVLRGLLDFFDIAPMRMGKWLGEIQNMTMIKREGSGFQFYHKTLASYLRNLKEDSDFTTLASSDQSIQIKPKDSNSNRMISKVPSINGKLIFHLCSYSAIAILSLYGLSSRFIFHDYWKIPDRIGLTINSPSVNFFDSSGTKIQIREKGRIWFRSDGKVHLGTYSGFTGPEGKLFATFGFPLSSSFNKPSMEDLPHGCVCLKKVSDPDWKVAFPLHNTYNQLDEPRSDTFAVEKGDIIVFTVNDIEHENNRYSFDISINHDTINRGN